MSGREPQAQKDSSQKGSCRGRQSLVHHAHARGVFVDQAVRSLEVEEIGARGDVAARPEHDAHLAVLQEIVGPHDVVDRLHLEIDVLHPGHGGGEQRDAVMHLVERQQSRRADPVIGAEIEHGGPELFVARRIGGLEPDMAELLDARVARREVAPDRDVRAQHQLERVLRRVAEADQVHHAALGAFFRRAALDCDAGGGELRGGGVELGTRLDLQPDNVLARFAGDVADVVIAIVAAQIGAPVLAPHELQTDDLGQEARRALDVARGEAHVLHVRDTDHVLLMNSGMSGFAPHMQNPPSSNGIWRGRHVSSTLRTPQEYS